MSETPDPDQRTVAELLVGLTWEDLTSDGHLTIEDIEAQLRTKGLDPDEGFEEMYGE